MAKNPPNATTPPAFTKEELEVLGFVIDRAHEVMQEMSPEDLANYLSAKQKVSALIKQWKK